MNRSGTGAPLRVGVVGHRNLPGTNPEQLQQAVRHVLALLVELAQERSGAGQTARVRLLSSLAEGADRIVAREALQGPLPIDLHCPLPFRREEYAKDFAAPDSRAEYEALLSRAAAVLEMGGDRHDADAAYLAAGEFLVASSDVLLAIWDGKEARGRAGTAPAVQTAQRMGVPVVWIQARAPHAVCLLQAPDQGLAEALRTQLATRVVRTTGSNRKEKRKDFPQIPSAWAVHDGRVPLVVGVAGHRELYADDDPRLERLKGEVRRLFADLRKRYPQTPMVVLSPLAAGANCLVAQVALEEPGVRLVAPLPLPEAEYEQNVQEVDGGRWLALHRKLRAQAAPAFVMPVPELPGEDLVNLKGKIPPAEAQFAATSAYLARHCHLLLALWDGVDVPDRIAGTAAAVRYRRSGVGRPFAPDPRPLMAPETGPVLQIVTPRRDQPDSGRAFPSQYLPPEGWPAGEKALKQLEDSIHRVFRRMDEYNAAVLAMAAAGHADLVENRRKFLPALPLRWRLGAMTLGEWLATEVATAPPEIRPLLDRYAAADTLALQYQGRTVKTLTGLLTMALGAVLLYNAYGNSLWGSHLMLLVGYMGVLLGGLAVWWQADRVVQEKNRHLDYRALAEGLRVQIMWRLAGLGDDVADHYLKREPGEHDWVRWGLRVWAIPEPGGVMPQTRPVAEVPQGQFRTVLVRWVRDQVKYYNKASRRDRKQLDHLNRWVIGAFAFGLFLAFCVLVARAVGWLTPDKLHNWLLLLIPLLPALAAVVDTFSEKLALSDEPKNYDRLRPVFRRARKAMARHLARRELDEFRNLVRILGRESLSEHGDWLEMHRERGLPAPRG